MFNLDYPSFPSLFDDPGVKRNVFDFASNKMEDATIKNMKREPTDVEVPGFVTEHIVEVSLSS